MTGITRTSVSAVSISPGSGCPDSLVVVPGKVWVKVSRGMLIEFEVCEQLGQPQQ